MVNKTVFVADKCGLLIACYRNSDLEALEWNHLETADTPVFQTVLKILIRVLCELVKYTFLWNDESYVKRIEFKASIEIPQLCCNFY